MQDLGIHHTNVNEAVDDATTFSIFYCKSMICLFAKSPQLTIKQWSISGLTCDKLINIQF